MRVLRLLWSGFVMNLKMLGTSSFFLLTSVVQPLIFATIAYYMFRSGGRSGGRSVACAGEQQRLAVDPQVLDPAGPRLDRDRVRVRSL